MGSSDHWELHSTPVRAEHPHKLFGILLHKEICLLFVLFTNCFEFNFVLRSSTLVNLASSYTQSKSKDCPRALHHANSTRFFVLLPLLILRFWDFNICLALFLLWEKGEAHRSRKTTKICSVKYIYIIIYIYNIYILYLYYIFIFIYLYFIYNIYIYIYYLYLYIYIYNYF